MPVVGSFGAVGFQVGSTGECLFWVWVDAGFSLGFGQPRQDSHIPAGKSPGARFRGSQGNLSTDTETVPIGAVRVEIGLVTKPVTPLSVAVGFVNQRRWASVDVR